MNDNNAHKISIITVVFDGEKYIEDTIKSIVNQIGVNFEYIIIDGRSTDGTVEIIKRYESKIDYWVSEPDSGLYHAMNKGLKQSTGEFVCFINAGDKLFDAHTLKLVSDKFSDDIDSVYGEVMFVDEKQQHLGLRSEMTTQKLPKILDWQSLKYGMVVSHQGFFVRREIAPEYIGHNLCADVDWVIKCLKKSRRNYFVDKPLAEFLIGGISNKHHQRSMIDRYHVLQSHFGFLPNLWHHVLIVLRAVYYKVV